MYFQNISAVIPVFSDLIYHWNEMLIIIVSYIFINFITCCLIRTPKFSRPTFLPPLTSPGFHLRRRTTPTVDFYNRVQRYSDSWFAREERAVSYPSSYEVGWRKFLAKKMVKKFEFICKRVLIFLKTGQQYTNLAAP